MTHTLFMWYHSARPTNSFFTIIVRGKNSGTSSNLGWDWSTAKSYTVDSRHKLRVRELLQTHSALLDHVKWQIEAHSGCQRIRNIVRLIENEERMVEDLQVKVSTHNGINNALEKETDTPFIVTFISFSQLLIQLSLFFQLFSFRFRITHSVCADTANYGIKTQTTCNFPPSRWDVFCIFQALIIILDDFAIRYGKYNSRIHKLMLCPIFNWENQNHLQTI